MAAQPKMLSCHTNLHVAQEVPGDARRRPRVRPLLGELQVKRACLPWELFRLDLAAAVREPDPGLAKCIVFAFAQLGLPPNESHRITAGLDSEADAGRGVMKGFSSLRPCVSPPRLPSRWHDPCGLVPASGLTGPVPIRRETPWYGFSTGPLGSR